MGREMRPPRPRPGSPGAWPQVPTCSGCMTWCQLNLSELNATEQITQEDESFLQQTEPLEGGSAPGSTLQFWTEWLALGGASRMCPGPNTPSLAPSGLAGMHSPPLKACVPGRALRHHVPPCIGMLQVVEVPGASALSEWTRSRLPRTTVDTHMAKKETLLFTVGW